LGTLLARAVLLVFRGVSHYSEFLLSVDHSLDTVVHVLDEIDLGATESAEVGDVEDAVIGLSMLSVSTTDLNVVLVGDGLELVLGSTKLGKLDVNGSAHASSTVGGAGSNVTEMLVVGELCLLLDLGSGNGEALEDLTNVGTLLHRDDTELVLLVDPNEESFGVVVEDTTSLRPFTLKTARLKILITALEKEVISDELCLVSLTHGGERVVLALKLTIEGFEGGDNLLLDLETLGSGHGGSERVIGEVTSNTDSCGVDHRVLISGEIGALELGVVHVRDVLIRRRVLMVLLDDFVEKWGEGVETLVATSVDTNARVGPLAS